MHHDNTKIHFSKFLKNWKLYVQNEKFLYFTVSIQSEDIFLSKKMILPNDQFKMIFKIQSTIWVYIQ